MSSDDRRASSLRELYRREATRLGHVEDPAQVRAVDELDELRARLIARSSARNAFVEFFRRQANREPECGVYLWGGVGRGKTWLMDLFFQSLPFRDKRRSHFHRFMQSVHEELKRHAARTDPLEEIADKLARSTRVLCFDELFVVDVADAMLLGTLLAALFRRGVTLVATSNVPPDALYRDGLQRARFLSAIQRIRQHTRVIELDSGIDYRLRLLERGTTWFDASDEDTTAQLLALFSAIAGDAGEIASEISINHRRIRTLRRASNVVWFDFDQICDGPRSQADYIEIGRCYDTVFLTDVPVLGSEREDQARRFVTLVDEFYDRGVKLLISAPVPAAELYRGSRLAFEFERTSSRLIEMQSKTYLSRPHRP